MQPDHDYVAMFKALGDPTRLRIFTFLCNCCCCVALDDETGEARPVEGPTVGEVCCRITGADKVTSTISHHLKELRIANLITMERRGKHILCGVNRDAVEALRGYLNKAATGSQIGCAGD
jgi:ArsR family transcriptional regulator, arsenate/arsenite/antimonite-responsive transcriptional repressor